MSSHALRTLALALTATTWLACKGSAPEPARPPAAQPAPSAPAPRVPVPEAPVAATASAETPAAESLTPAPAAAPMPRTETPTTAPAPAVPVAPAPTAAKPAPSGPAPTARAPSPVASAPAPEAPRASSPPADPDVREPATLTAPAVPSTPPAPPSVPAAPAPVAKRNVRDPGGVIAVKPTKSGLKKVGATRCGSCHEIQIDSWKESGHAKRDPQLDCESCHGPGSEYKKSSIMKDAAQAKKAGLVKPEREFCTQCHRDDWADDMLKKVHEHGKVSAGDDEDE